MLKFKNYIQEHWSTFAIIIVAIISILTALMGNSAKLDELKFTIIISMTGIITVIIIIIKSDISNLRKTIEVAEKYFNSKTDVSKELDFLLYKHLDPTLKSLLENHMKDEKKRIVNALVNQRIAITHKDDFAVVYLEVFKQFTNSQVVGTSLTDKNYFWTAKGESNNAVENEIQSFTAKKGKLKRFFYISDNNIGDPRTVKVLEKQAEIGVEVFLIKKSKEIPFKLFVYCEEKGFGWTAKIDNDSKSLREFIFTKNEQDIQEYKEYQKKIELYAVPWVKGIPLSTLLG